MAEIDRLTVSVSPDTRDFRKKLRAALSNLPEAEAPVTADTDEASRELAAWRAQQAARTVTQRVNVDRNALSQVSGVLGRVAKTATVSALAIAAVSSAVQFLGTLGPLLVSSLGVLGIVPGLAFAAAAALGTVMLGMDGVKQAFSAAKPELDALKGAVSATFAQALIPAVNNVRAILPQLTVGFQTMAAALSDVAVSFTNTFRQGAQIAAVNNLLNLSAQLTRNLGAALGPLVAAFVNIARIGLQVFLPYTTGAAAASQRFLEFTQSAEGATKIAGWMQGGIEALKTLWTILKQLGGIVTGVFRGLASGGNNIAGAFGSALGAVNGFINSPAGQALLHDLGAALADIARVVRDVLGQAFKSLGPAIQALLPAIREFANQWGSTLVSALKVAGPLLTGIFGFLSANMGWIGPAAIGIGSVVAATIAWGKAMKVVNLVTSMNPMMRIAAIAIAAISIIIANWDKVKVVVLAVWNAIQVAAQAVWQFLVGLWQGFVGVMSTIWQGIVVAAQTAWNGVLWAIQGVADIATAVWNGFLAFMGWIWSGIQTAASAVWNGILWIIQGVVNTATAVWNGFLGFMSWIWQGISNSASAVWNFISSIVSGVAGFLTGVWNGFLGFMGSVWNGISGAAGAASGFVSSVWNGAVNAIAGFFHWLGGVAQSVWNGIVSGLKAVLNGAISVINGVISGINIIPGVSIPSIPGLAEGGTIDHSGTVLVGERGPELLHLGRGAQVTPLGGGDKRRAKAGAFGTDTESGSIDAAVERALSGWMIQIDENGLARMVNRANQRKARR